MNGEGCAIFVIMVMMLCIGFICGLKVALPSKDDPNMVTKVECLTDHPNICRTIMIKTTDYKEIKKEETK